MHLTCALAPPGRLKLLALLAVRNLIGMRQTEGSCHLLRFILKGASPLFPNAFLGLLLRWMFDVNPLDLDAFHLACHVISEHMWPILRTRVFIFMCIMLRAYLKWGGKKRLFWVLQHWLNLAHFARPPGCLVVAASSRLIHPPLQFSRRTPPHTHTHTHTPQPRFAKGWRVCGNTHLSPADGGFPGHTVPPARLPSRALASSAAAPAGYWHHIRLD